MLDSDVARLYNYKTKRINETVSRNIERFPKEFCFQLIEEEKENMWSQIATASELKSDKFRNKKYLPYVFTEHGQIYDAYSLIVDIIKRAKTKILIIDNYIDDSILQMLSKKNKNVNVIILTSSKCKITKLDINKFNKQYPSIKIVNTNKFHDRFIVIDNKELYHCGASLKDLGKKCFAISKILDTNYIEEINKVC